MTTPRDVSDHSHCPHCWAENERLGGGTGHGDVVFNHGGALWAACAVHQVRWYVTRELSGVPAAAALAGLREVNGIDPPPRELAALLGSMCGQRPR